MKSKHAIQLYRDHIATLHDMLDGVKDDIDHFIKDALKWIETSQHEEESDTLADLEHQLSDL